VLYFAICPNNQDCKGLPVALTNGADLVGVTENNIDRSTENSLYKYVIDPAVSWFTIKVEAEVDVVTP
jgi:hypothetical protein